jgi:hypothetical protein
MELKSTSDNVSSETKDTQADEAAPTYITSEQFNSAFTARSRSMEKQITELKELVLKMSTNSKPTEPEEKQLSATAQMKMEFEAMKKERDQEKQAKLDLEMRTKVKDTLSKLNVKPALVKALMAQLIDSDKTIGYSDDGVVAYKNSYGDYEDLESSLKSLIKLPEYQDFFLAKGALGSGSKSPKTRSLEPSDESVDTLHSFFGIK